MTTFDTEYAEVRVTCSSKDEAQLIADELVEHGLAACVHLSTIDSVYEWNDEVHHDREFLLTAPTRTDRFDAIVGTITTLHSYDLPAITMLPLTASDDYLAWIDTQVGGGGAPSSDDG